MSAVVCGKRSLFEDLYGSPPISKRLRCGGGNSPLHFTSATPLRSGPAGLSESGSPQLPGSPSLEDKLSQLRSLFPLMDPQVVEKILDSCENNLDSAIKSLHDLSLNAYEDQNALEASSPEDAQLSQGDPVQLLGAQSTPHSNGHADVSASAPIEGSEWVELLVREMMSATDLDDARARAARTLEAFERTVMAHSGASVDNLQKENVALKNQLQGLLRENQILKKAVAIQHQRQLEHDERARELQQLKQLLTQYQEQIRTLELNNYALSLHLQKAQEGSSISGRFHPDVF